MPRTKSTAPTTPRRPSSRGTRWEARFLAHLERWGSVIRAARLAHVDRKTAYKRRATDPAFADAWDAARRLGIEALEDSVVDRARRSDRLALAILAAEKPDKYGRVRIDLHALDAEIADRLARVAGGSEAGPLGALADDAGRGAGPEGADAP